MKITFPAPTTMKVQADFRIHRGMGEFGLIFFSPSQDCYFSWVVDTEKGVFLVHLHQDDKRVFTVRWGAESDEEKAYFDGQIFIQDDKDSTYFLFVPLPKLEDIKTSQFISERINMEEPSSVPRP